MTGSQVIDAEEDRHKLVVEYKDALQPADFYHNFKQRGIRSVQLIPYLEFDDRGDLTAASVTAELWGKFLIALFECWVRADISRISIELFDATLQKWCGSENPQPRCDCRVRLASPVPARSAGDARQRALCGLSGVLFLLRTAYAGDA
ncbi:hypothetical protein ECZU38_20260 [Escherichia coli]|nr:hypothetical protein ECZU38_20260 [Escherichia coli]